MTDSLERFLQDLRFDVPAALVERAKASAAVDAIDVRQPGRGTLHNRRDFETRRQHRAPALVAVLLAIAIVATLMLTVRGLRSHTAPARTPPVAASASCSTSIYLGPLVEGQTLGYLHMMSPTVGWRNLPSGPNRPGPDRTTDGGASWQSVPPLAFSDSGYGIQPSCFLDANHAWVSERAGGLVIFRTADGGRTWQHGAPIAVGDGVASSWLAFIDDQHGWLLIGSQPRSSPHETRTIYATTDGGLHWSQVVRASDTDHTVLGTLNVGCLETGISFVSTDTGWMTWDCYTYYGSQSPGFRRIAITRDGGRSWQPVVQPISSPTSACDASPPLFAGNRGVLLERCGESIVSGFRWYVLTTYDTGGTWSFYQMPLFPQVGLDGGCCPEDFVDPSVGWVFSGGFGTPSNLYRTTNGGQNWALVKPGLFSGQDVYAFQFLSSGTGFVYVGPPYGSGAPDFGQAVLWKTTDGGHTWSKS